MTGALVTSEPSGARIDGAGAGSARRASRVVLQSWNNHAWRASVWASVRRASRPGHALFSLGVFALVGVFTSLDPYVAPLHLWIKLPTMAVLTLCASWFFRSMGGTSRGGSGRA